MNQYPNPTEYSTPPIGVIITTYELAEEPKDHYFWKATVSILWRDYRTCISDIKCSP